jgi:hypothetical protein
MGARTRGWLFLGTMFQAVCTLLAGILLWKSAREDESFPTLPIWSSPEGYGAMAFSSASMGLQGIMGKRVNTQFATTGTYLLWSLEYWLICITFSRANHGVVRIDGRPAPVPCTFCSDARIENYRCRRVVPWWVLGTVSFGPNWLRCYLHGWKRTQGHDRSVLVEGSL